jgi:hypothetical protein
VTTHIFTQQITLIKNTKTDHKTHFTLVGGGGGVDDDDDNNNNNNNNNNTTAHKVHTTNSALDTMFIVSFAVVIYSVYKLSVAPACQ